MSKLTNAVSPPIIGFQIPLGPQPSAPPPQTYFHYPPQPQPPPPPPPPPPTTTTAIGTPMNLTSQFNGPNYNNNNSPVAWSTGLCGCFEDVSNCCLTWWCPCITFGRIAEIADGGSTSCGLAGALYALIASMTGCACFYSCFYRSKMRAQYSLKGSSCTDCCIHCWCEACALCQEHRELANRGFDMSIGWHGNIARQQRLQGTTAPVVQGGMAR